MPCGRHILHTLNQLHPHFSLSSLLIPLMSFETGRHQHECLNTTSVDLTHPRASAQKFADDSATHILSAGQALAQFNTILLGTSSDLYVWQPRIEKFQYDKTDVSELLIEGLSHVMSARLVLHAQRSDFYLTIAFT